MRKLENVYLPAYFIGSGFSAVFPSIISIIQGASSYKCVFNEQANQTFPQYIKPRFSSTTFYLIMFAWTILACFSFYLLNRHKKRILSDNYTKYLNINHSIKRDCIILISIGALGIEINTILPSLLSYVTLPYSQQAYFWALILSALGKRLK
jgi:hypothetical protein